MSGIKPGHCLECFLSFRESLSLPTVCPRCKHYKFLWNMIPDRGAYFERMLHLFYQYSGSNYIPGNSRDIKVL